MTSVAIGVDQLFFRIPGGIGTYVENLLRALRIEDPSLDITAFHARFDPPPPSAISGLRRVQLRQRIRTLYPMWAWLRRPALPPSLAASDLIHMPSPVAVPGTGGRARMVVTVHDLAFRRYPKAYPASWRYLHAAGLSRALRSADALIAVSEHTAGDLVRLGRFDPGRIHVVPLASSLPVGTADPGPVLERLAIPRPYVLFVGTLEPRKNVVRLIEAYRSIAASVPHALVLAGPHGWGRAAIDRELARGGPGRVLATGRLDPDDLDALHRGADAFVYPSHYEGFGLPVLDAMARGIPVITSNTSSLPELVGDAAVQVPPGSVTGLAEGLRGLLLDRDARTALSTLGLGRARRYSWERTARETIAVYEKAMAG